MQRLCDKYNRAIDSIHQLVGGLHPHLGPVSSSRPPELWFRPPPCPSVMVWGLQCPRVWTLWPGAGTVLMQMAGAELASGPGPCGCPGSRAEPAGNREPSWGFSPTGALGARTDQLVGRAVPGSLLCPGPSCTCMHAQPDTSIPTHTLSTHMHVGSHHWHTHAGSHMPLRTENSSVLLKI